jgi:hypothetical protein
VPPTCPGRQSTTVRCGRARSSILLVGPLVTADGANSQAEYAGSIPVIRSTT